ncbi:MAG TPA: radical SAM protein, partial [Methanomassiliicoccales archaeon]|nr:radical SAM protein [Methanomassiliicoccales archaeon]
MRAVIIDGYVDEPGSLGVPPFMHPMVRAAYGAAIDAGCDVDLITIDHVRRNGLIPRAEFYLILSGCAVPGRYIRAMPASLREVLALTDRLPGRIVLGGPAALERADLSRFDAATDKDPAAALYDLITTGGWKTRWRTAKEWERWLMLGADCAVFHPDFPQPLIAEIDTYRGCVRYRSGGCSFCVEPLKGKPVFREPDGIVKEVTKLWQLGVRNFRLGSQTCIVSYKAHLDKTDVPR